MPPRPSVSRWRHARHPSLAGSLVRRGNMRPYTLTITTLAWLAGCAGDNGVLSSGATLLADLEPASDANILTIEHAVPHVSTVPANAGTPVSLAVRERVREEGDAGEKA